MEAIIFVDLTLKTKRQLLAYSAQYKWYELQREMWEYGQDWEKYYWEKKTPRLSICLK